MDRIEHRPVIRPQRRVDFGTAQANTTPTGTAPRRTGIHFNDIPEASNTHQQPEDDPGPFYPQNQNLRRTEEQGDYGEEEEEDEDFLPRPRAPRRQNRNQGNITKSETVQEVLVPTVFKGAITRQRAKILQHKFNESMILASDLGHVKLAGESSLKKDELSEEPAKEKQASSEVMWPFISEQGHTNLMIITMEDQLA
ncbi:hypothetical protein Bca4012_006664 [Brassica carinata]